MCAVGGTRRCINTELTYLIPRKVATTPCIYHWAHGVIPTLDQRPWLGLTLIQCWIDVLDVGSCRRCISSDSTHVDSELIQRRVYLTGHTVVYQRWINVVQSLYSAVYISLHWHMHGEVSTLNQRPWRWFSFYTTPGICVYMWVLYQVFWQWVTTWSGYI